MSLAQDSQMLLIIPSPNSNREDNSMSSHSIHTQSNNALHTAPRASATVGLFDQAIVAAVVIAIAYIASIMVGGL
jgi:hypothetical protein